MEKVTKEQFEELRRKLSQSTTVAEFPTWPGIGAGMLERDGLATPARIWSPRLGGVFTIPEGIPNDQIRLSDDGIRKRVSSWIWERNAAFEGLAANEVAELPELTPDMIRELEKRELLPVEFRIDRALRAIGRPPTELNPEGPSDSEHGIFMAATECGARAEMEWLLHQLKEEGLLTRNPDVPHFMLSLKGLDRLENGGKALVSNTAFVAMWFDEEVREAYDEGIVPAIQEAGYEPVRIDEKEHSDRIDDWIVAETRRSRFLVCDFTCGTLRDEKAKSGASAVSRGGVYYEAGLAHGLGKKVIWTCRKDLLDHVHFDVRQYNFVVWEKGKECRLKKKLLDRIRAVIA